VQFLVGCLIECPAILVNDSAMTQPSEQSENSESTAPGSTAANPISQPLDPDYEAPAFGWTSYAERLNGRFAMVGFMALLLLEIWTRQDFFTWLGLP
jgi:hypothetical protein